MKAYAPIPSARKVLLEPRRMSLPKTVFGFVIKASCPLLRLLGCVVRHPERPVPVQFPTKAAEFPMGDAELRSSPEQVEEAVALVAKQKTAWSLTSPGERAALARQCARNAHKLADEVVAAERQYKGSYGGDGEAYVGYYCVVQILNQLATTLECFHRQQQRSVVEVKSRTTSTGEQQAVVTVIPNDYHDLILLPGFRGEIWVEPGMAGGGQAANRVGGTGGVAPGGGGGGGGAQEATQGKEFERGRQGGGQVCALLGAGNHLNVVMGDVLQKMLVESCVVVCKMNPVNEYNGKRLEAILQPLAATGALRFVYGGGDVGAAICNHPNVDSMHITGSDKTFDAIVWQGKPKAGKPPYSKPVTSELGCVSPVVVVPGAWSDADLDNKALDVVSGVVHNASFNCLAVKVLVLAKGWPQREQFLDRVAHHLHKAPRRACYYPGSKERHAAFLQAYPKAQALGTPAVGGDAAGALPWLLARGVAPKPGEYALVHEPWCGVLTELCLDVADDPEQFMQDAAKVCNDSMWGTLSCGVYCHPSTQKAHAAAFEQLVADLKYGAVVVNSNGLIAFGMDQLGWGGCGGTSSPADVQSGVGMVHNTLLIDHVHKSVLRLPWVPLPITPFWYPTNRNLRALGRRMIDYAAVRSFVNLLKVLSEALRG